jgi:hypothetical protein
MLLGALATIGEQIASEEFDTVYAACCDPGSLQGNQTIETVVELIFNHDGESLTYTDYRIVDPGDPLEMAIQYGYANRYNQYDHSLTQRASSDLRKELPRMLDWPTDEEIGPVRENPFIKSLSAAFEQYQDAMEADVDAIADEVEYKALLTVRIDEDGESRYPGEIESVMKGTFNAYKEGLHTGSNATGSTGEGRCSVCDAEETVYGLGAQLDAMYALKKQWPFPQFNASLSWQSRPLCEACIRHIETATKLFLDKQSFGAPGVRCRIIPYALPVKGGTDRLRTLASAARETITEEDHQQPLGAAWNAYRERVDIGVDDDCLRLAFVHYERDSNKSHGIAYIDGVSVDRFTTIQTAVSDVIETDDLGVFTDERQPSPLSEKSLFTGMWLYDLFCEESDSDFNGDRIGDSDQWVSLTEDLLTNSEISYPDVISGVVTEALARSRSTREESDDPEFRSSNYPYDNSHIVQAYAFVRVIQQLNLLTDSRTDHSMQHETITGDYTTFGDGLAEFVTAHRSIDESPGRTAAFVLGALAERLSAWQKQRNLNRTFIQNRSVSSLTTDTLTRWQRDIWEKSKTYNAQEGNYGAPWATATELFHDAVLVGQEDGWNATKEELQYHYILGTTIGPTVHARARENAQDTEDAEPATPEATAETDAQASHKSN